MEWMQVIFMMITSSSLIVWFRSESRSDWRHTDAKLDLYRQESNEKLELYRQESQAQIKAIHEEIKDFHGRLCAIEERRKP